MKYTTSITDLKDGKEILRGNDLSELATTRSFAATIFLTLTGRLPEENEEKLFSALLSIGIDHGPGTASAQVARISASAVVPFNSAIASGILAMGERHGGAIEGAARFFVENHGSENLSELISDLKANKVRIPGYGHAVLEVDNRSKTLLNLAKELDLYGTYCTFAESVHAELNAQSSKTLPLNIDGSMAAILLDLGFKPSIMKGVFIISRVTGLVAQIDEELKQENGLRRVPESDIQFV